MISSPRELTQDGSQSLEVVPACIGGDIGVETRDYRVAVDQAPYGERTHQYRVDDVHQAGAETLYPRTQPRIRESPRPVLVDDRNQGSPRLTLNYAGPEGAHRGRHDQHEVTAADQLSHGVLQPGDDPVDSRFPGLG